MHLSTLVSISTQLVVRAKDCGFVLDNADTIFEQSKLEYEALVEIYGRYKTYVNSKALSKAEAEEFVRLRESLFKSHLLLLESRNELDAFVKGVRAFVAINDKVGDIDVEKKKGFKKKEDGNGS